MRLIIIYDIFISVKLGDFQSMELAYSSRDQDKEKVEDAESLLNTWLDELDSLAWVSFVCYHNYNKGWIFRSEVSTMLKRELTIVWNVNDVWIHFLHRISGTNVLELSFVFRIIGFVTFITYYITLVDLT